MELAGRPVSIFFLFLVEGRLNMSTFDNLKAEVAKQGGGDSQKLKGILHKLGGICKDKYTDGSPSIKGRIDALSGSGDDLVKKAKDIIGMAKGKCGGDTKDGGKKEDPIKSAFGAIKTEGFPTTVAERFAQADQLSKKILTNIQTNRTELEEIKKDLDTLPSPTVCDELKPGEKYDRVKLEEKYESFLLELAKLERETIEIQKYIQPSNKEEDPLVVQYLRSLRAILNELLGFYATRGMIDPRPSGPPAPGVPAAREEETLMVGGGLEEEDSMVGGGQDKGKKGKGGNGGSGGSGFGDRPDESGFGSSYKDYESKRLSQNYDITSGILDLKFKVKKAVEVCGGRAKDATALAGRAPPIKCDTLHQTHMIDNYDIIETANLKKILIAAEPYYYFDMPLKPPTLGGDPKETMSSALSDLPPHIISRLVVQKSIDHDFTYKVEVIPKSAKVTIADTKGFKFDDKTNTLTGKHSKIENIKITIKATNGSNEETKDLMIKFVKEFASEEIEDRPYNKYDELMKPETYKNIQAVNGFAVFELLQLHACMMKNEEAKFIFQNDICKYLFRFPENKEEGFDFTKYWSDKKTYNQLNKQVFFLAIIHQYHFIGTLLEKYGVDNSSEKGTDSTIDIDTEKRALAEIDLAEKEIANLSKVLAESNATIDDITKKITSIPSNNLDKTNPRSWLGFLTGYAKNIPSIFQTLFTEYDTLVKFLTNPIGIQKKDKLTLELDTLRKETRTKLKTATPAIAQSLLKTLYKKENEYDIMERERTTKQNRMDQLEQQIKSLIDTEYNKLTIASLTPGSPPPLLYALVKYVTNLQTGIVFIEKELEKVKARKATAETDAEAAKKNLGSAATSLTIAKNKKKVPSFRIDTSSADAKEEDLLKDMFTKKYNYANTFKLSDNAKKYITEDLLSGWIQAVYKKYGDSTYYLQNFKRVQTQLARPSTLIGPIPSLADVKAAGTPEKAFAAAATPPSFSKAERDKGLSNVITITAREKDNEKNRLSDTIKKNIVTLLATNKKESILDEVRQQKLYAVQKDPKKSKEITIADYDEILQQFKVAIESELRGKETLIPIRTQIATIQNAIKSYNSLQNN